MSTTQDDPLKASTNNWDTAFALTFKNVNKAIANLKSYPASFTGKLPGSNTFGHSQDPMTVQGDFGAWQLNSGSGSLVHMTLPISGKVTDDSSQQSEKYTATATVEVELNFLPGVAPSTSHQSGGSGKMLKVKTTPDNSQTPVASIIKFDCDNSDVTDNVRKVLFKWLNDNLDTFTHTFADISVGATADKGAFQWMMPTKVGYAINNPEGASPDDYVFGVMAMTENRPGVNLGSQLSPNIIPAGCNAGFLISQERFMTKIVLPDISAMFKGASSSDFTITEDGTRISNVNPVVFADMTTANKDGDTVTISGATLEVDKFRLTASADTLNLNMIGIHFPWGDDGGYTVNISYNADSKLSMDKNNKLHLTTTSKPTLNVVVEESSGEKWENIILGIIEGIGLAVAGAALGALLGPAVDATTEAVTEAASDALDSAVDGDPLEFTIETPSDIDPDVTNVEEANEEASSEASDDVKAENSGDESYKAKFKGFYKRNWRKVLGMMVGGAVGAVLAKLPDILEAYSEKDLAKVPSLDEFMDTAISPTKWANQTGYTVKSVELHESFQMGLDVTIGD